MQGKEKFSAQAKREMMELARAALEAAVRGQKLPKAGEVSAELELQRGIFVTLKNRGMLRGCLGRFEADTPLKVLVPQMTAASTTEDPRFLSNPITPEELPGIEIKISVLSPRHKVDSPEEVQVGEHGIYITAGFSSGCYLPEVATEYNMSREEFLTSCCRDKAGLPPEAWKSPKTEVYVFTTQSIGEE